MCFKDDRAVSNFKLRISRECCLIAVAGVLLCGTLPASSAQPAALFRHRPVYAVAAIPTPVLDTPKFRAVFGGRSGGTLRLNKEGEFVDLEFIALPGTVFTVQRTMWGRPPKILKVTTPDYPYPTRRGYYIDSRFVKILNEKPSERKKILPSEETILDHLLSCAGLPYLWGGNVSGGIPEMLALYPPARNLIEGEKSKWTLKGLDCSGLLYEATNGGTPRDAIGMVSFGTPVHIEGLSVDGIITQVQPLDVIAWNTHMMIILDRKRIIESRPYYDYPDKKMPDGVRIRPLREALEETMHTKTAVDDYRQPQRGMRKHFVIRRWYHG